MPSPADLMAEGLAAAGGGTPGQRAAVPYLILPRDGGPYLVGSRCGRCGATFAGSRSVCARCFARDAMTSVRLAETGTLYTYTIVHRSFPGVRTPFIAAVVDLDGGGTVSGTLVDRPPDPAHLPSGLPIRVIFCDTGQRDETGAAFIAPYFTAVDPFQGAVQ